MLRESSLTHDEALDFAAVMDGGVDSGVPHGAAARALRRGGAHRSGSEREAARRALVDAMGAEALVDAAGVVSNFERMVRVADATGISIGPMTAEGFELVRALGIERFGPGAPGSG